MDDILNVQDLHVEIKTHHGIVKAVRGVSFHLAPKETLAIVGESGCGKSISVKATMRLLPSNGRISQGSVQLEGRELITLSEREMLKIRGSDIAMIFQDPMTSLTPTMTVGKQIVEMLKAHRKDMSAADMKKRAVELLELVASPTRRCATSSTLTSSPAACASGWSSPSPWPVTPRCSSPTSPPPPWT